MTQKIDFSTRESREKLLHFYSEGCSDAEVSAEFQISKEQFDKFHKEDEIFRLLVSFGRTLALACWERLLRETAKGGKGNVQAIKMIMQNRYGWTDKSETSAIDHLNVEGMTRDEALQKLRDLQPRVVELIQNKAKK